MAVQGTRSRARGDRPGSGRRLPRRRGDRRRRGRQVAAAREAFAAAADQGALTDWIQATRSAASVPLAAFAGLLPEEVRADDALELMRRSTDVAAGARRRPGDRARRRRRAAARPDLGRAGAASGDEPPGLRGRHDPLGRADPGRDRVAVEGRRRAARRARAAERRRHRRARRVRARAARSRRPSLRWVSERSRATRSTCASSCSARSRRARSRSSKGCGGCAGRPPVGGTLVELVQTGWRDCRASSGRRSSCSRSASRCGWRRSPSLTSYDVLLDAEAHGLVVTAGDRDPARAPALRRGPARPMPALRARAAAAWHSRRRCRSARR